MWPPDWSTFIPDAIGNLVVAVVGGMIAAAIVTAIENRRVARLKETLARAQWKPLARELLDAVPPGDAALLPYVGIVALQIEREWGERVDRVREIALRAPDNAGAAEFVAFTEHDVNAFRVWESEATHRWNSILIQHLGESGYGIKGASFPSTEMSYYFYDRTLYDVPRATPEPEWIELADEVFQGQEMKAISDDFRSKSRVLVEKYTGVRMQLEREALGPSTPASGSLRVGRDDW